MALVVPNPVASAPRRSPVRSSLPLVGVLAMLLLLAVAPAVRAEVSSGAAQDPTGDGPLPARDLTGISAVYDSAGMVRATVTLAAAPSAAEDAFLAVTVGTGSGGSCAAPFVLIGAFLDPGDPQTLWARNVDGTSTTWTGAKAVDGKAITVVAPASSIDAKLAAQGYTCAKARLVSRSDAAVEYDALDVPAALVVQQAQPGPPAGTPKPPVGSPKPPAKAKLALTATAPKGLHRNRWATVRVRLANRGTAPARSVRLHARGARGVQLRQAAASWAVLAAGRSRALAVRVRVTDNARARSTLSLAATAAGKLSARRSVTLRVAAPPRKPPRKPKPPATPKPPAASASLAGLYFTHVRVQVMSSNEWSGYLFVDDRWVYRGIPEGGAPVCKRRTATVDAKGNEQDGCLPYVYDAKRKRLTIDGKAAKVDARRTLLQVGGQGYDLMPLAKAGSRWQLSLKGIYVAGYWPNQVVTTTWLTMTKDGRFAMSSQSLASFGTPGAPGSGNWAAIRPDQKGAYTVLPRGVLELRYESGKVERQTIAIARDAKTGSADPAKDGLLLDSELYFTDD